MTQLDILKLRLPDYSELNLSDAVLQSYLDSAKAVILTRRFPLSDLPDEIEARYMDLQIRMAVEAISRIGTEGQLAHSENGISRSFEAGAFSPSLLAEITPIARMF